MSSQWQLWGHNYRAVAPVLIYYMANKTELAKCVIKSTKVFKKSLKTYSFWEEEILICGPAL